MTTKQPDPLRLANILRGIDARNRFANKMLSAAAETIESLHAENEILRHKLKTLEDLGKAGEDVQLLRMGYAAARLEIESLKAQLEAVGAGGVGPMLGAPAQPAAQAQDDVRDAARLEIASLQACLKKANEGFERFEREWYLRGDEIEALKAQLEAVGAGGVSPLIGASQGGV